MGYGAARFGALDANTPVAPWPMMGMLYSRVTSIYGGSSEIQRNIIARTVLNP